MASTEEPIIEIDETAQGEGEEAIPDCSTDLFSEQALANETTFDNENGSLFLVGGDGCVAKTRQAFKQRGKKMKKRKERLQEKRAEKAKKSGKAKKEGKVNPEEEADAEFSKRDLKALKKFEEQEAQTEGYSDGYAMIASWVWEKGDLGKDDVAGLCIADPAEVPEGGQANLASCWTLSRKGKAGRKVDYNSFTLDPTLLTADVDLGALLDTNADATNDLYPGFFGSWQCGKIDKRKRKEGKRERVNCKRFLPTNENSSSTDFRFVKGPVNVYTYLSSRDAASDEPTTLRLLAEDGSDVTPVEAMGPLELFQVQLQGGIFNLAQSGLALGLSMLALGA